MRGAALEEVAHDVVCASLARAIIMGEGRTAFKDKELPAGDEPLGASGWKAGDALHARALELVPRLLEGVPHTAHGVAVEARAGGAGRCKRSMNAAARSGDRERGRLTPRGPAAG